MLERRTPERESGVRSSPCCILKQHTYTSKKYWGALHKRGASERFAALSYATVCYKKAPRSAPRHSLELSFGEQFLQRTVA